ncbi:MAG: hypothetical protein ACTH56_08520 [Pseudoalteromonas sp.]
MRDSVFKLVFKRGANSDKIGLFVWLKLLLLEAYLGEQLVEMLSVTASYKERTKGRNFGGSSSNGAKEPLSFFIPATMFNRFLSSHILQLLDIKYHQHYGILREFTNTEVEEQPKYEANPNNLFMLVELKLAYNTIWVTLNITVDVLVYLVTNDVIATLASGAIIEFIRRFKW